MPRSHQDPSSAFLLLLQIVMWSTLVCGLVAVLVVVMIR
jgi:hypothetical protein